jgi:hypothetical protein
MPESSPHNQTSELLRQLAEKRELAAQQSRRRVADAEMTLAFLSGNQTIEYSWSGGISEVDNETGEHRDVDNRMLNAYRRWLWYMFKEDPVMTAFEGGHELRDAESAAVAASLCDYWETQLGWREVRQECAAWVAVAGIGFLAPVWKKNPTRKIKRKRYEYSDQAVESPDGTISFVLEKEVEDYAADMAFEFYNPLQTYLFPLDARSWGQVTGVMTVDMVDEDWVKNHLSDSLPGTAAKVDRKNLPFDVLDRVNRFVSPDFGLVDDLHAASSRWLLTQWFERPTAAHPQGRYVVVLGDRIVKDTRLPYIEEARSIDPGDNYNITMGIIPHFAMKFPGRLVPPAPMGQLRPAQIRYNELLTDQRINRRTVGRTKLLYEKGTLDEDAWNNSHAERIGLDPSAAIKPQLVQGAPLVGLRDEKMDALASFEEASGQTGVLRGQNPAQVRGAFHLDILREESMVLAYADTDQAEHAYELCARLALAIAKHRYTPERVIQIVGRDRAGMALTFKTAVINTDVRVRTGSMHPRNHAVREAKLVELLQYGAFIDPQTGKPNLQLYWEMTELGTLNRSLDPIQRQRIRAREESVRMLLYSDVIMPFDHEDHLIHIEEHLAAMARPEWYEAENAIKALMLSHIEAHRNIAADQLAPETTIPIDPVAGLAQGGGPVPSMSPGDSGPAPAVGPRPGAQPQLAATGEQTQ